MTTTHALSLNASAMTRRLRAARLGVIRSYALADGALRVFAYGTDEARAIAAHLLQVGYEAAATGDRVTVTLPEQEAPLQVTADRLADEAARLQAAEGVTERVEQMYADARAARAEAHAAPAVEVVDEPLHNEGDPIEDTTGEEPGAGSAVWTPADDARARELRVAEQEASRQDAPLTEQELDELGALLDRHRHRPRRIAEHAAERVEALLDEVEARAEQQYADDEADREINRLAVLVAPSTAGPLTHEHEEWQLDESALGGRYCRACGGHVDETPEPGPEVDDPREQPAPLEWSEGAAPSLSALDGRPRALRYRR
jgi:hypothetical protein